MEWHEEDHPKDENNQLFVKKGTSLGTPKEEMTYIQRFFFWTVIANGKSIPLLKNGNIDTDEYERVYNELPFERQSLDMEVDDYVEWSRQLGLIQQRNAPKKKYGNSIVVRVNGKYVLTSGSFETPCIEDVLTSEEFSKKKRRGHRRNDT